jgi:hypothetical protein
MRIFISSLFKNLLEIEQCCLELGYYRLGTLDDIKNNEGNFIETLEEMRLDFIEQDKSRSPSNGVYVYDGVIFPQENKMMISLQVPIGDQGMSENEYKTIYCIYKNLLTGNGGIAFIITGDKLEDSDSIFIDYTNKFGEPGKTFNSGPLNLTLEKNIITLPLPEYKCTLLVTQKDDDLFFLENNGVGRNYNIYRYFESHPQKTVDRNFFSKNSFDSYYKTVRGDDDFTHNNTVYINKFGIKIY